VEVGEMEETYRHGAESKNGDLRANVSSQAYHRSGGGTSATIAQYRR
jgi:hypothetical protein